MSTQINTNTTNDNQKVESVNNSKGVVATKGKKQMNQNSKSEKKSFENKFRANSTFKFQADVEKQAFIQFIQEEMFDKFKSGYVIPKRGYFYVGDKWVPRTQDRTIIPKSEHQILAIHDGCIQVPAAILGAPVASYIHKKLSPIQEKQLTEYLGLTKEQSRVFYGFANLIEEALPEEDGIVFATMLFMLPRVVELDEPVIKSLLLKWPLNNDASKDFFNLAKLILVKLVRKHPIGLHVTLYDNYNKNGFVIGSKASHHYKGHQHKDTLADNFDDKVVSLVASQPRLRASVARSYDTIMAQQPIHESFILEFDGDKPLKPSADAFYQRSGISVHNMNKSAAINAVKSWNKAMSEKLAQAAINHVNVELTRQLKDQVQVEPRQPRGRKRGDCKGGDDTCNTLDLSFDDDDDLPVRGYCMDGNVSVESLQQLISDPNLAKKGLTTELKIGQLYTNQAQKQKDKLFNEYKDLSHPPTNVSRFSNWYLGKPLSLVKNAMENPFIGLTAQEQEWLTNARNAFNWGVPEVPNVYSEDGVFTQNIVLNVPDAATFAQMVANTRNDYVTVRSIELIKQFGDHASVKVEITVPDIYTTDTIAAPFVPKYMSNNSHVDMVLVDVLKNDREFAEHFISVCKKYRLCAGNPVGQLVRYGKEITVNKGIELAHAQIDPCKIFRAPKFMPTNIKLDWIKNAWSMMDLVNTEKAAAGLLYGDGKKGMKTTVADLCLLDQLFEKEFLYMDWMGAHQMKPKFEITDMTKFWSKTRSIFVGNSFIQVLMTPLFAGIYDFGYDYSNPLLTAAQVFSRQNCLNITQQKFIEVIRSLSEDDKNKLVEIFGEEVLFAYSDNVYYFNIRTGVFVSGDGVAMESQVKKEHVRAMFAVLKSLYIRGQATRILWEIEPGTHKNPKYDPDAVDMHYNPSYFFVEEFEDFCEYFKYVKEFEFTRDEQGIHLVWDYGEFDEVFDHITEFFIKCFDGSVVLGNYTAPLGFLPSGWYTTSLLNTLVSLGYIWAVKERAKREGVSLFEVFTDPKGTEGFNFTVENDVNTNIYGEGFQRLDFLGFDLKDGCAVLRESGLFPSVVYYQDYSAHMPQFRKNAIHIATWISALFNGGITIPQMRQMFEYEMVVRSTDNITNVFSGDFDEGLIEAIGVDAQMSFNITTLYARAAKMCGMKTIPTPTTDVKFRFQSFGATDEYNLGEDKHMAVPTACQLFLNGRHPAYPQLKLTPETYYKGLGFIAALVSDLETFPEQFVEDLLKGRNFRFKATPEDEYEDAYGALVGGPINWKNVLKRKRNSKRLSAAVGDDVPGNVERIDKDSHEGGDLSNNTSSENNNGGQTHNRSDNQTNNQLGASSNDEEAERTKKRKNKKGNKGGQNNVQPQKQTKTKIELEGEKYYTLEELNEVGSQLPGDQPK